MTTSKTGGSGPPSKARPQASADAVVAPARPRSTRTFPETAPGSDRLPRITARADLAAHDGSEVRVVGTYVERDVRMRPTPPPAYQGHVAIALADGTQVALIAAWDDDAPRPQAEIDRLAGQTVEVVGTLYLRGLPDPDGGASLVGPTLDDIRALRATR